MRFLIISIITFTWSSIVCSQESCENKMGAWVWYLELTGLDSHEELADSLYEVGIRRVYLKVADGTIDSIWWPEIVDASVVEAYHDRDIEVWAWSYNYPGNEYLQGEALYQAAKTGYDGYVVDIEMQFDGLSDPVTYLFDAFYDARQRAYDDGHITEPWPIYCTTWGNPKDHNFRIDLIDPWVDGYMPQTYVEIWGQPYINNLELIIVIGTEEYQALGATKPIHHMTATEKNIMTGDELNRFMKTAGPEFSIWRIPGGGTPSEIWDDWVEVDWDYDFCQPTSVGLTDLDAIAIYPTLTSHTIYLSSAGKSIDYEIIDMQGRLVQRGASSDEIAVYTLQSGMYALKIGSSDDLVIRRFIKY